MILRWVKNCLSDGTFTVTNKKGGNRLWKYDIKD